MSETASPQSAGVSSVGVMVANGHPNMGVLLRLKLRLLRNSLRSGGASAIGFALGAIVACCCIPIGIAVLVALRFSIGQNTSAPQGVIVLYAVIMAAWLVVPITVGQSDGTLDPLVLRLYPLAARTWIFGMLGASLVSLPAMALAVVLLASPVVATTVTGGLIALIAGACQLALSLLISQLVLAALYRLGRHRRGRDVVAAVAGIAALSLGAIGQMFGVVVSGLTWEQVDRAGSLLSWTPLGWCGRALAETMRGEELRAILWLIPALMALPVVGWLWWRLLAAALVAPEAAGSVRKSSSLHPGLLKRLPRSATTAVLARELRAVRRDSQGLVSIAGFVPLLIVLAVPAREVLTGRDPRAMLLTSSVGLMCGLTTYNLLGLDRGGVTFDALAAPTYRPILIGKLAAYTIISGSVAVLAVFVMALWTAGWSRLPAALLIAAGGYALSAGIGLYQSARHPQPFPPPGRSPFAGSDRPGADITSALLRLVSMVGLAFCTSPFAAALWFTRDSVVGATGVATIWFVLGIVVLAWSINVNARWLDIHRPEVIQAMVR